LVEYDEVPVSVLEFVEAASRARWSMLREQKITLGEMRESGPRRLLVYCADYKCAHHVEIDADVWPAGAWKSPSTGCLDVRRSIK
jgi:hypothetical protein